VIIWIASILLISAVALFIAAPLTDQVFAGRRSALSTGSDQREHEYVLALQGLRELEFDHAMGKLDAGDYHVLRDRLEKRALAAMSVREKTVRQRPTEQAAPAVAEPQPIMPARAVTVRFCPQCGTRIGPTHNFCANCGVALALPSLAVK
jgi:cytochrome c-type biogenesis protein CcmI